MINIIKEHIEYKKQMIKLAWFDVVKNYKGTVFGWIWIVIKPTTIIFVYWFAFTYGLRIGTTVDGFPYIIWLIAGIIPWFFMSDVMFTGISSMKSKGFLVNKIKFPISVIATFDTIARYIPHLMLIGLLTIIYGCIYGFDIYLIQLPFYLILIFIYFASLSLILSLIAVLSKDFLNLIKTLSTPLFWLSGILWNIYTIDLGWLKTLLLFNPITFFSEGYRKVFIHKEWFFSNINELLGFAIVFMLTICFAIFVYNKTSKEIGDLL